MYMGLGCGWGGAGLSGVSYVACTLVAHYVADSSKIWPKGVFFFLLTSLLVIPMYIFSGVTNNEEADPPSLALPPLSPPRPTPTPTPSK